jgi:hypothetical protein
VLAKDPWKYMLQTALQTSSTVSVECKFPRDNGGNGWREPISRLLEVRVVVVREG